MMTNIVRIERTMDGHLEEHWFDAAGYDVWGYDPAGRYDRKYERAPFQASPFSTDQNCADDDRGSNPTGAE